MRRHYLFKLLVSVSLLFSVDGQGVEIIERSQQLGPRIKVDWTVNFPEESVTFLVTAETRGFIGFGKLKFRHFRPQPDGKYVELPWISHDDNYDFDFQQNRQLKRNVRVLPGDHLTVECTYDTSTRDPPSTTFGGWSTREEMCEVIFMYHPRIALSYCGSFLPYETTLPILGLQEFHPETNYTTNPPNPTISLPEEYAGLNYSTYLNTVLDWTPEIKENLQTAVLTSDHREECHGSQTTKREKGSGHGKKAEEFWTNYPKDFVAYVPPENNCGKVQ